MIGKTCLTLVCLVALAGAALNVHAGAPPPLPAAPGKAVDASAIGPLEWQALWGTAPAATVAVQGGQAWRMPCNFRGTRFERASWDCKVKLDLTACSGLQFQFYCPNARPISSFSFYLRSRDGWYSTGFGHTATQGWNTITIDKCDTRLEQTPAGWAGVDTVRISAWRGGDEDTEFYLARLAPVGADASIALIRGESAMMRTPGQANSVSELAQALGQTLEELGLPYVLMSDRDVTAERLQGKKIVILPHNPSFPEGFGEQLARFVRGGGKVLSFYSVLPAPLARVLGFRMGPFIGNAPGGRFASIRTAGTGPMPGAPSEVRQRSSCITHAEPADGQARVAAWWFDAAGKPTGEAAILASNGGVHMTHVLMAEDAAQRRRLLLAMLGALDSKVWGEAVAHQIRQLWSFGPYDGFDAMLKAMGPAAERKPAVRQALADARRLRREAGSLLAARQYPEAMAVAAQAREAAVQAHCALQDPQAGEFRAWWCHSAFGPQGMSWDESIKILADQGFTAILPNMLWGGTAYYESRVLPVAPEVALRGDQIAQCVAACKKYGVACHVWKVNWNMGGHQTEAFGERMRREGRTQVDFSGKPTPNWLCPSHPANQRLEIDAMVEVATRYDVDGIHFDYIRYSGLDGCFCPGCRERFERSLGRKVGRWPADTREDPAIRQQWLDFRRENINRVVAAVSERVRKARPKVKISAAVFPNWAVDRDTIGQDWKLWCERGWLDFVCPMDYTSNAGQFENQVRQQLDWVGKVPCYPGIGLSVWSPSQDAVKLLDFIVATRRLKTGGFTIFQYDLPTARSVAPLCGMGITRKE